MKYQNHKDNIIEVKKALTEYENSNLSLNEISKKYNIPLSSFYYYRNKNIKNNQSGGHHSLNSGHIKNINYKEPNKIYSNIEVVKSETIEETIKPNEIKTKKTIKRLNEADLINIADKFGL